MGSYKVINMPSTYGAVKNDPERIVIHSMAQFIELGDKDVHAPDFLERLGFSAHFLIDVSGDVIVCRNTNQGAYHAKGFNDGSIGIEFLVRGIHTYESFLETIKSPYLTTDQYKTGLELVSEIIDANMNIHAINRHSDLSPGRKFDPGVGFPWEKFLKGIKL